MGLRSWVTLLATIAVGVGCSSDDKPAPIASGASSGSGGAQNRGGSDGDAAAGGDSSGGADGPTGGASDLPPIGDIGGEGVLHGDGGAPPNPAPRCSRDVTWSWQPLTGLDTAEDERLLAMTHDGATLVFARDAQLFVRDDGEESSVPLPAGYTHTSGVAVTPDGLSLVIVADGGLGFAQVSRSSRGASFGAEPSTAPFAYINDARVTSGDILSWPTLSADGESLYYTARKGPSVANVWRARGAQLFMDARRQDPVTLGTEDGKAKLVVSVSADERTLFVFDEALGHVTGLWSATPAAEFTGAVQFEGLESVFSNLACDELYGSRRDGGSLDVVAGLPK
jgi:hypothetical protein